MITIQLSVTTNAGGVGSASDVLDAGKAYLLHAVEWIDGTLVDGVDAVLSCTARAMGQADKTLLTLTDANIDKCYFPRELEHSNVGAALTTYSLPVVDGTLQLAVTAGGNAMTGGCVCYLVEV
jgi:hypothetical protein